jgi:phage shock protein E
MDRNKMIVWIVVAVVVVGLGALLFIPKGSSPSGTAAVPTASPGASTDIDAAQLRALVGKGALLVDVRTAGEFSGGHIEGAVNVPVEDVPKESAAWDPARPVVVYCQTGARSLNAAGYLAANGFKSVYNLASGIEAWDGSVVGGASAGSAGASSGPASGKPTMYEFATGT